MGGKVMKNEVIHYWQNLQQSPEKRYKSYLNGDSWCCPDAPINKDLLLQVERNTGAHHWIELKTGEPGEFYCRYCYIMRRFRVSPYPTTDQNIDWHNRDPMHDHKPTLIDTITGQYKHQLNQRPRRRAGKMQGVIQS